jgi:hypothetical protein
VSAELAFTDGRGVAVLVMRRLGVPGYVLPLVECAARLLVRGGAPAGSPRLAAMAAVACEGAEAARAVEAGEPLVLDCEPACGAALRVLDYVYVVDVSRGAELWRVKVFKPLSDLASMQRRERDRLYASAASGRGGAPGLRLERVFEVRPRELGGAHG